jgi:hypothetical protein
VIRNLTPHPVRVMRSEPWPIDSPLPADAIREEYPPDGPPARLATVDLGTQNDGTAVYELVEFGHVHNLPEPEPDSWLIVSLPVALACLPGRSDLLVPYREVRNDQGTVVGCEMLARPV